MKNIQNLFLGLTTLFIVVYLSTCTKGGINDEDYSPPPEWIDPYPPSPPPILDTQVMINEAMKYGALGLLGNDARATALFGKLFLINPKQMRECPMRRRSTRIPTSMEALGDTSRWKNLEWTIYCDENAFPVSIQLNYHVSVPSPYKADWSIQLDQDSMYFLFEGNSRGRGGFFEESYDDGFYIYYLTLENLHIKIDTATIKIMDGFANFSLDFYRYEYWKETVLIANLEGEIIHIYDDKAEVVIDSLFYEANFTDE